jgi:hypothetical protein
LARLASARLPADLLGESPADDVEDPTGHGLPAHRKTVARLTALVDALVPLAWP